jgi:hypothetical protein
MDQQLLAAAENDPAVMIRCVDECERCHRICLHTAMMYSLEQGVEHVEPAHLRLMMACADLCRATADSLLAGFDTSEDLCAICARVCAQCGESCARVGELAECMEACRACAAACAAVSG